MAALRREHIVPFVIALSLFGALYQDLHWITLAQFALGGAFGIALKWAGWSRAPFLLGFVMGPLAEISYIQTSQIWGWAMFARPATIVMLLIFAFFIARAILQKREISEARLGGSDAILAMPLLALFSAALLVVLGQSQGGSPVPEIISIIGVALAILVLAKALIDRASPGKEGLGAFDNLTLTAIYLIAVPLVGLPVSSALFAVALMRRAQTGWPVAIGCGAIFALVQVLLFSMIVDVSHEPLITGWIFRGLS